MMFSDDIPSALPVSRIYEAVNQQTIPANILLVEDDDSDAALARIALDALGMPYRIEQLETGADVVPYLLHEGVFSEKPKPDLVLLDLEMPGRSGFDILAELSALPAEKRRIPIAIMTGHKHLDYLKNCYDLPIADYVVKPCSAAKLRSVLMRAHIQQVPVRLAA